MEAERIFKDTADNTLSEGKVIKSGNFKLKRKITSMDDLFMILIRDESLFARHRMYPSAFFFSWNFKLVYLWVSWGCFWEVERVDKGRLIDIIDTTNEPNILQEKIDI